MSRAWTLVDVSPLALAHVWSCVALFYAVCGTFLAYQAAAYFYIPIKAIPMLTIMASLSIGVSGAYFTPIGGIYCALAAVHYYGLLKMVVLTLRFKRLVFATADPKSASSILDRVGRMSMHRLSLTMQPTLPPPTSRVRRLGQFTRACVLSLWRSFNVTSPNYGIAYVARELIQTGIQTYQAYRLSALVARQWMNSVIVILLVLNCWATPIITYFVRSSLGYARLLCLLVNLALDFVSYIVFPVALFLPYYSDFNGQIGNFDIHFWYTDVWLIQVINEWQMLLITSLWDALSKFFIAYNITRSLRSIPKLLCCRGAAVGPGPHSQAPTRTPFAVVPEPLSKRSKDSASSFSVQPSSHPTESPDWRDRTERGGHRILAFWGLVVLVLHIQTAATGNNNSCMIQVRPWLTRRPVCSLMELSCHDGKLSGNASDFDHAIESIQSDWLAYLIIRHCEHVEITPNIHQLPWLMGLKIYNSTIESWDEDAALTQTHNPQMTFMFLVMIKAQAIPPGSYDQDYPHKLFDVELSEWNVTSLPDEVADVWPAGMFLVLEGFEFASFPPALAILRPAGLSISSNNFSDIPSEFWENEGLVFLNLNANPITELPSTRPTPLDYQFLSIVATQISRLPSWVEGTSVYETYAGSTPLCGSLEAGNASALGLTATELSYFQGYVNCIPASEYPCLTHYPLTDEPFHNPSKAE